MNILDLGIAKQREEIERVIVSKEDPLSSLGPKTIQDSVPKSLSAEVLVLKSNIDLGKKVSEYVNGQVPLILNFLDRDRTALEFIQNEGMTMAEFSQKTGELFEALKVDRNASDYALLTIPHISRNDKEKAISNIAKTSAEFQIGTCIEMSAVGYFFCKKQNIPAEIFLVVPNTHAILVIGRDPKSNPRDFRTWGPKAVICDSWANNIYPASEIPQRLKIYTNTDYSKDGSVTTCFKPFSYLQHTFSLLI